MLRRVSGLACGLVLLPVLLGGTALASERAGAGTLALTSSGIRAAYARVPFGNADGGAVTAAPVLVAQSVDPQIQALEEEVRKLTGKVEDLNFQVLQMQDKINKMQQDNEFRFQQLEKGGAKKSELVEPRAPVASASPQTPDETKAADNQARGEPPRSLGTLNLDVNGNVISSSVNDATPPSADAGAQPPASAGNGGAQVAALPQTDNPNVLYKQGYDLILSGDYASAEAAFRAHIKRYPADPQTADARYWLGEAFYGQQRYSEAAQVFLDTHRNYPKARTAAEDMLKLGMSLAHLGNRKVACATFKEVGAEYPDAPASVQDKVAKERARSGC